MRRDCTSKSSVSMYRSLMASITSLIVTGEGSDPSSGVNADFKLTHLVAFGN